jgi:hypothetical protein
MTTVSILTYLMLRDIEDGKQHILPTFGIKAPKTSILPTGNGLGEEGDCMPITAQEIDSHIGEAGGSKFVKLEAGRPKVIGIDDVNVTTLTMTDPKTGVEKIVNGIAVTISSEDGKSCKKTMTFTSKKLIQQLKQDLAKGVYKTKNLRLMKIGEGFNVEYETSWLPK